MPRRYIMNAAQLYHECRAQVYIINVRVAGPGGEGLLPPGEDDITDQYYADQYDQYYRYG